MASRFNVLPTENEQQAFEQLMMILRAVWRDMQDPHCFFYHSVFKRFARWFIPHVKAGLDDCVTVYHQSVLGLPTKSDLSAEVMPSAVEIVESQETSVVHTGGQSLTEPLTNGDLGKEPQIEVMPSSQPGAVPEQSLTNICVPVDVAQPSLVQQVLVLIRQSRALALSPLPAILPENQPQHLYYHAFLFYLVEEVRQQVLW